MNARQPARRSGKTVTSDARSRKMRAVLAACKRLALDNDDRKELQLELTGCGSMSDMDERQLDTLLDHLNRDWQGTNPQRPHIAKIKALWWSLYWLGEVDEPNDKALSAFVQRQTGVSALRFLDHSKSASVIEALKSWLQRTGIDWKTDADIEAANASWKISAGRDLWDRHAVIDRIANHLFTHSIINIGGVNYARNALKLPVNRYTWTARQCDDVIRLLGKKWRAERPAP